MARAAGYTFRWMRPPAPGWYAHAQAPRGVGGSASFLSRPTISVTAEKPLSKKFAEAHDEEVIHKT